MTLDGLPGPSPPGNLKDQSQRVCVDRLGLTGLSSHQVPLFSDLKRHVICDAQKPHFCSDPPEGRGQLCPADPDRPVGDCPVLADIESADHPESSQSSRSGIASVRPTGVRTAVMSVETRGTVPDEFRSRR
jgi:hypothetical protein